MYMPENGRLEYERSRVGLPEKKYTGLGKRLIKFSRAVRKGIKLPFEEIDECHGKDVVALHYPDKTKSKAIELTNRNVISACLMNRTWLNSQVNHRNKVCLTTLSLGTTMAFSLNLMTF